MKWELRNGNIISDVKMTKKKLDTADLYDGKRKLEIPVTVNHALAERIRKMTNSEFVKHFGVVGRKIND
jgi:hypothetical protein